jgi:Concanavalin A-like lectin/glucanases superfamily
MVSWWPGDGNANDIQDGNNGTLMNGATFAPGEVDQAFQFNSSSENERVFIADSPNLAITASLTLDAWVNAASPPPNGIGDIIFRGDDRPFLDPYTLRMVGSNVRFQISDAAGNIAYVEASLPLNQFMLVAGTLDDATGVMTLYLNGTVAAQTTTTVRPYGTLTGPNPGVSIGNLQSDTTLEPFIGLIDEVEVFSRALAVSEVLAIYNAGSSGKCKLGATLNVPGTANIFGAGHATPSGGGDLPPVFNIAPGSNRVLTLSSVTGSVSYNSGGNFNDPDGIGSASDINVSSTEGISGIINTHAGFLTGVFVNDSEPMDPPPPVLDFSVIGTSFTSLSPALNQTFFIGDGLTGDGSGSVQQFMVPAGATRLFLGFADACSYHGPPSCYGDNLGSFTATFTIVQP